MCTLCTLTCPTAPSGTRAQARAQAHDTAACMPSIRAYKYIPSIEQRCIPLRTASDDSSISRQDKDHSAANGECVAEAPNRKPHCKKGSTKTDQNRTTNLDCRRESNSNCCLFTSSRTWLYRRLEALYPRILAAPAYRIAHPLLGPLPNLTFHLSSLSSLFLPPLQLPHTVSFILTGRDLVPLSLSSLYSA